MIARALRPWLAVGLMLLGACAHVSRHERLQAADYAEAARSTDVACADCAVASPLLALGDAAYARSTPEAPRHTAILLDAGQDSLLARVHHCIGDGIALISVMMSSGPRSVNRAEQHQRGSSAAMPS